MKSLFKDPENESVLELGIEDNNKLSIIMEDNSDYLIHLELDLQEALVLQGEINKYLEQIKANHRSQLPWHKQFGI
jgi:hypothetical protein